MQLLSALRHRPFALLWGGQTLSRLGDSLTRIALVWWIVKKTGSPETMGTVLIFAFAPMIIFLLIGGVAADRLPKIRVMLASDVFRALIVGAVSLLAFSGVLEVWHLFIAALFIGFVDAFFQPAYTATVPQITPPELLPSANALTSLSAQLSGIVGPALGAIIVKVAGESAAFGLDAISFVISAACLIPLLKVPLPTRTEESPSVFHDMREGIRTVLASSWLWVSVAIAALSNIFLSGTLDVAQPFLVKDTLHLDVDALGLFNSTASLGSVIGAVYLGRVKKLHHRGILLYGAWVIASLAVGVRGLPITVAGIALASFIFGVAITTVGLVWINTLQEFVPPHLLGRVSSVDQFGSFVFIPVGYGIAGWLTHQIGAPLVMIIGGALSAFLAILGLLVPAIRKLD